MTISLFNFLNLNRLSIKRLTILGFTLVALPLIMVIFYAAQQIKDISAQGTTAIFQVANLEQTNRQLTQTVINAERFASQFLVLQEPELRIEYTQQQDKIKRLLNQQALVEQDEVLTETGEQINLALAHIAALLKTRQFELSLKQLQQEFKTITHATDAFRAQSNLLIEENANHLLKLEQESNNLMLKSLLIIPISSLLAALFIYLITQPLKALQKQIKLLTIGKLEQPIKVESSPEINAIADALEVMRTRIHALELQKSSFIRHISHELKTPLAAIREGTSLIEDNSVGPLNNEQQEICGIIKNSVTKLQKLIEDLLDFNIVLDSTSLQDSQQVSLSDIVNTVINERKLDIKRKQLAIDVQTNNISLLTNAKQLSVVIDNILSNAIKYSPEKSTISIKATLHNTILNFSITDQGIGIDKAIQPRVFEAFYQGPSADNTLVKSSGLGLTIVKELTMRLSGEITIVSQTAEVSGTQVQIMLPRAKAIPLNSTTNDQIPHLDDIKNDD